nr:MAG TPA: hypothetical protein [Myoviridae sp. ctPkE24]
MLPCPSTHEAGSIPALTFRPGNTSFFLTITIFGIRVRLQLVKYVF